MVVSDSYLEKSGRLDNGLEERIVSTSSWKHEVKDLHAVMYIARMVHLAIEHGSEALVRVGVEIATCKTARKCLYWHDYWYSEHDKREWFRKMVHDKLTLAIKNLKGISYEDEPDSEEEESEDVKRLKLEATQAEAALQAARSQQQIAELRCRECEQLVDQAEAKVLELEKVIERLRKQLIEERDKVTPSSDASVQVDMVPPPVAAAPPPPPEVVYAPPAQEQPAPPPPAAAPPPEPAPPPVRKPAPKKAQPKKAPEPKEPEEVPPEEEEEEPVETAPADVPVNTAPAKKGKPAKAKPAEKPQAAPVIQGLSSAEEEALRAEMKALMEKLARANKKLKDSEESLRSTEAQLAELAEANERAAAAEARCTALQRQLAAAAAAPAPKARQEPPPKAPEPEAPPPPPPRAAQEAPGGLSQELLDELESLRKLRGKYDKLQAKLAEREAELEASRQELRDLDAKHMRMMQVLANVRDQLKKVHEIAEKKGYGKELNEVFGEAGLKKTLESDEFTCFGRLYQDALRRQQKQKDFDQMRESGQEVRYSFIRRGQGQQLREIAQRARASMLSRESSPGDFGGGDFGGSDYSAPPFGPPASAPPGQAGRWVWVPDGQEPPAAEQEPSPAASHRGSRSPLRGRPTMQHLPLEIPGSRKTGLDFEEKVRGIAAFRGVASQSTSRSQSNEPSEAASINWLSESAGLRGSAIFGPPLVQQMPSGVFRGSTAGVLPRAASQETMEDRPPSRSGSEHHRSTLRSPNGASPKGSSPWEKARAAFIANGSHSGSERLRGTLPSSNSALTSPQGVSPSAKPSKQASGHTHEAGGHPSKASKQGSGHAHEDTRDAGHSAMMLDLVGNSAMPLPRSVSDAGMSPTSQGGQRTITRSNSDAGIQLMPQAVHSRLFGSGGGTNSLKEFKLSSEVKTLSPLQRFLSIRLEASQRSNGLSPGASPAREKSAIGVCKGFSHLAPLMQQVGSNKLADSPLARSRRTMPAASPKDAAVSNMIFDPAQLPARGEESRSGSDGSLTPVGSRQRGRSSVLTSLVRAS